MIYLGAVPTTLGFTTWAFALRGATAGRTASLNYLIPVVAVVLGWAVLGQTPPRLAVAGVPSVSSASTSPAGEPGRASGTLPVPREIPPPVRK